mgnify:CR=1 FL=1
MWNIFSRANDDKLKYRVHVDDSQAWYRLGECLRQQIDLMSKATGREKDILVVCIGTDRSTGDCLGPLTGTLLSEAADPNIIVKGTLSEPVHATNLKDAIVEIESLQSNRLVIAVDACLGRSESVGYISLSRGPLKPGTGVNKVLPEVGDMHITGIVNVGGYMEYLVLQNTRLSLVMKMATSIAKAIQYAASFHSLTARPGPITDNMDQVLARRESAVSAVTAAEPVRPR